MKKTDIAYLAGIIDGEGSIALVPNNRGKNLQPRIVVAMSTKQPVKWIHKTFGGCYRKRWMEITPPRIGNSGYRYTWGVYNKDGVIAILEACMPYLKTKRRKAQEVIRYFEALPQ
jgi:hypothetical protein